MYAIIKGNTGFLKNNAFSNQNSDLNKAFRRVNYIIAYSGYGYRAQLLSEMLANNELENNTSRLPLAIENIAPTPSYELSSKQFKCN